MLVLDMLTYAANPRSLASVPSGWVEVFVGDICDRNKVDDPMSRSDACVHLAAESRNGGSILNQEPLFRTNMGEIYVFFWGVEAS